MIRPFICSVLFILTANGLTAQIEAYELVMTSLRTGETELFATDLRTGSTKNLTMASRSEERYPAVSPDGKRILFTSNRWNNDTAFNLFSMNADGSGIRQLTFYKEEIVYYPGWSGDAKKILYNLGRSSSVVVMNTDGSRPKTFTDMRDAHLSPDGSQIAFTRKCGSGYCLFIMNILNDSIRQLTEKPNDLGAVGPVFSPDGTSIAYVDCPDNSRDVLEIFSCDTRGNNRRQLTTLNKISTSPCWSPDGQWISFRVTNDAFWRNDSTKNAAYVSKEGDKRPVWIMQRDGSLAAPVQPLRFQCGIDGSRASWRKK